MCSQIICAFSSGLVMASESSPPDWTPKSLNTEVNRIVAGMLRFSNNQEKLAYLKAELAKISEPSYRSATETLILVRESIMDGKDLPTPGPMAFLREAIRAVPAVKYALGVGGVVAVIAIVSSFGISYRVAVVGFPIILILMVLLVVFAKLAAANPQHFLLPLAVLTWFSIIAMVATMVLIFTGVFFKWPLDLHHWLVKD
jgi:hypothetical protein